MQRLKKKWNIESNWQLMVIFIVFAVTGSTAAKFAGPIVDLLGISGDNPWVYWPLRILLIFPIYQILLVFFGWLFGEFTFFWNFEKKMLRAMGLSSLVD